MYVLPRLASSHNKPSIVAELFKRRSKASHCSSMAFKRSLTQRLFTISGITNQCRISPSTWNPPTNSPDSDSGEDGFFRRYFHRQSMTSSPELRLFPFGETLLEKLRGMDIVKGRIKVDDLIMPPKENLTVGDAKKILKLSQLELLKSRLRQIDKGCVCYSEFLRICVEECSSEDQGIEFARLLDESGGVIVIGDSVFLRPEQVVQAIQGLIPVPPRHNHNDPRIKELEKLEKEKAVIDEKAQSQVRRELWCGLGFFVVQTAAFMRLTFWELTWDVMEPICFYVTSIYFMGGYAFFLRTSKEPSFEGFFQSRFLTKQGRLMKLRNFDVERYNHLKKAYHHNSNAPR